MTWKPGKLASGTLTVGIGMGLRALTQALVFLIIARTLGVDGYGSFAAVIATAGALAYFSGLGANILLVRDTARNPDQFRTSWGYTLAAYCLGTPIAIIIYGITAWLVLPPAIPWAVIILLGISEIALVPLAGFGVFAYQGHEQMYKVSLMQLVPAIVRLAGAFILLGVHRLKAPFDLLLLWSYLHLCCALTTVACVLLCVKRDLGSPIFPKTKDLLEYVQHSIPFSFSGIAERFYADGDKFLLARLASVGTTGLYSAGYRFVDLAFIPLHALMSTASPRYFRAGKNGVVSALKYSLQIGSMPLIYGFTIGCLIYWLSPLLPLMIGHSYAEATIIIRWLAWLPLIAVPRILLHYPMVTSGLQRAGMHALLIGAGSNIFLNLAWIPSLNWRGAVAATYTSELLMIISMIMSIRNSLKIKSKNKIVLK